MPLRTLPAIHSRAGRDELLLRLVDEWRNPRVEGQPDIVIDENCTRNGIRSYVIWDDWRGWSQIERSEVVTEAFEVIKGPAEADRLVFAMGLTTAESEQWKLPR